MRHGRLIWLHLVLLLYSLPLLSLSPLSMAVLLPCSLAQHGVHARWPSPAIAWRDRPTVVAFSVAASPALCNISSPRGQTRLHQIAFLGHRLPSQTNTSLFSALCPHSCAPRKNFLIGHPSLTFSSPSTLNFRVLWRWASEKEVATYWYHA